jgi:hypothetical protein
MAAFGEWIVNDHQVASRCNGVGFRTTLPLLHQHHVDEASVGPSTVRFAVAAKVVSSS